MSNIQSTGAIGERLVLEYLQTTDEYEDIGFSKNPYDMHKDILIIKDGKRLKVECKTRTVIRKFFAMSLEKDQWYKADNADKLFFISNPTSLDEKIHIYEATPDCYSVVQSFGPKNVPVRMYGLDKMKKVKTIDNPSIIAQLYNLSVSKYKQ